jgi:hypothetical protein
LRHLQHKGGETFTVHDEKAFIAELRQLFGEPQVEQGSRPRLLRWFLRVYGDIKWRLARFFLRPRVIVWSVIVIFVVLMVAHARYARANLGVNKPAPVKAKPAHRQPRIVKGTQ